MITLFNNNNNNINNKNIIYIYIVNIELFLNSNFIINLIKVQTLKE